MFYHPDLHLHSNVSDGSDTPLQLLEKVRQTDIDLFALTDHDTYQGCRQIQQALQPGDPAFLAGVEFSCRDGLGKYHILGYRYDTNKPSIVDAVQLTHDARRQKAVNRLQFLQENYGYTFTEEEKRQLFANPNPGKPHIVTLLLQKGYIREKAEGFALLGKYHSVERALTPEEAIDAILQADGVPVLAHGILGTGSADLSLVQIEERVKRLKGFGLMGLECYYSGYRPDQQQIMLQLSEQYNLMVTAGSDYHGKNKTVALGETGTPDPEKMQRFYRAVKTLLGI